MDTRLFAAENEIGVVSGSHDDWKILETLILMTVDLDDSCDGYRLINLGVGASASAVTNSPVYRWYPYWNLVMMIPGSEGS